MAIRLFNGKNFNGHGEISVGIATPEQKQPFAQKLVSKNKFILTPVARFRDSTE